MASNFVDDLVKYPEDLPCPQADTDLVPRERRYISDISDVRNMRMFQQEFQATRNRISFIFTEEEARQFREWYETTILHGGAWFYADWPLLHKDKKVTHRFVGQPKYEWLVGSNPGMMGRSYAGGGFYTGHGTLTMCKVTATVEVYEPRKAGRFANVYTSKLYPVIAIDDMSARYTAKGMPSVLYEDRFGAIYSILEGNIKGGVKNLEFGPDDFSAEYTIIEGNLRQYTFGSYEFEEHFGAVYSIVSGEIESHLLTYDYFEDDGLGAELYTIVSGEIT